MGISDWIAFAALTVAAVGPTASSIRSGGKREGKIDAVLERLTQITDDHENRLRILQAGK